jgi:hypothetical protein
VWLGLAAFLLPAGIVYGFTSHEVAGAPLLIVAATAFSYLGIVARSQGRRPKEGLEGEAPAEPLLHVPPTIWPFAFSITGLVLVIGFVVAPWLVVLGVVLFAVSAAGWLSDVARGHRHAG